MTYTDKKDSEKLNTLAKTPNIQITEINYLRNNIAFNHSVINYFNSGISFYNHVTRLQSKASEKEVDSRSDFDKL